jgi:hypothetical protein
MDLYLSNSISHWNYAKMLARMIPVFSKSSREVMVSPLGREDAGYQS